MVLIASEIDISLQDEEEFCITTEKHFNAESKRNRSRLDRPIKSGAKLQEIYPILLEDKEKAEGFSASMKGKIKYRDVADAAQAAFESAACAADAARAAVEFSRSESYDPDDQISPSFYLKKVSNTPDPSLANYHEELKIENDDGGSRQKKNARETKKIVSGSSPYALDNILQVNAFPTNTEVQTTALEREAVFDVSDDEGSNKQRASFLSGIQDLEYEMKHSLLTRRTSSHNSNTNNVNDTSYGNDSASSTFHKKYPLTSHAASKWKREQGATKNYSQRSNAEHSLQTNLENRPVSVRSR